MADSNIARLEQWAEAARTNDGLVDVKFFPLSTTEVDIEFAAGVALVLLEGKEDERDITDEYITG